MKIIKAALLCLAVLLAVLLVACISKTTEEKTPGLEEAVSTAVDAYLYGYPLIMSQRNKFITNSDGSMDMYLQAESPGKAKEANWLPAPKGKFVLVMRLYWPMTTPPSIIDGSWTPPAVKRAD